jgi:hypothetical protein
VNTRQECKNLATPKSSRFFEFDRLTAQVQYFHDKYDEDRTFEDF